MTRIRQVIASVTEDRRISAREWKDVLAPAIERLPHRAGVGARQLLTLWGDDQVTFAGNTREALGNALMARGYPLEDFYTAAPLEPSRSTVIAARAANVTETDLEFERLRRIVGAGPTGEKRVLAAVLDGGFKTENDALVKRLWENVPEKRGKKGVDDDQNGIIDDVHGADFVDGDVNLHDNAEDTTHGLGSATVLARGNRHVDIATVRAYGKLTPESLKNSMQYAVDQGARVVLMSFLIDEPAETAAALEVIRANPNVAFIKSAGNEGKPLGRGTLTKENALAANAEPNLAVVGAELMGEVAFYSNRGAKYVTHAATPEHLTPLADGGFGVFTATSAAAARIGSIVAKQLELDPTLDAKTALEIISLTSNQAPAFKRHVRSGGVADDDRAMRLTTLRALVRSGLTPQDAVTKLRVAPEEMQVLEGLLQKLQS